MMRTFGKAFMKAFGFITGMWTACIMVDTVGRCMSYMSKEDAKEE